MWRYLCDRFLITTVNKRKLVQVRGNKIRLSLKEKGGRLFDNFTRALSLDRNPAGLKHSIESSRRRTGVGLACCCLRKGRACSQTIRPHSLCGPYPRSEEHTSELQSLMRISYAVFCLKQK